MTKHFFTAQQRPTILDARARIIPADHEPGAREAGTTDFLDRCLSSIGFIYAKPEGSGFEALHGGQAAAWQQRVEQLRKTYCNGIVELDRYSRASHGRGFVGLTPEQQDHVLTAVEHAEPDPPHGRQLRALRA